MDTEIIKNKVRSTKERLDELGFKVAAKTISKARGLALAYEHYRYVRWEKIMEFNEKLKKQTIHGNEFQQDWQELVFEDISMYEKVPPAHVLDSLETAKGRKIFDSFDIAYIKEVKDPILFGIIEGCTDKFFIDQWDSDVSISDILKENEG